MAERCAVSRGGDAHITPNDAPYIRESHSTYDRLRTLRTTQFGKTIIDNIQRGRIFLRVPMGCESDAVPIFGKGEFERHEPG